MKINTKNLVNHFKIKVLIALLVFQSIFIYFAQKTYGASRFYFSERTGEGYITDGRSSSANMNIDSFITDFYIDDSEAPFGTYRITSVSVEIDKAMPLHDRYLYVDGRRVSQFRDAERGSGSSYWETGYRDTIYLNKTVTIEDRYDYIEIEIYTDTSRTSDTITSFGRYIDVTIEFELVAPIRNNPPIASIIQPWDGQTFLKYQKPQIKYNVYDADDDRITATTYYGSTEIDKRYSLRNREQVTINLSDSFWEGLPFNRDLLFWVKVEDGKDRSSDSITIRKISDPPSVELKSPIVDSSYRTDQPPEFKATLSDPDGDVLSATLQYLDGSTWKDVITNSNLASGETTSLKAPKAAWESLGFNTFYQFRVKASDGYSEAFSNTVKVKKINTAPNVAILKPIQNEKMFWGYLPFTWQINDIDNDPISLKIWTDTPNIVNNGVLFDGTLGRSPYLNNYLSRAYLPLGKHNIHFEFKDTYHTVQKTVAIEIEDIVNLNINDNDTFYIPIFSKEKSDVYYRRINNALDAKKHIFNIMELPVNQSYIHNIQGAENVTGDSNYTNNGSRIYTTDGEFDVKKVADWIFSKVNSSENPIIKVVETGNTITLKNIKFEDEEKDYTTTVPVPKGKDRQFKFEHYPQIYENADSEITNNGEWLRDDTFTMFDGNEVVRNGEDITITLGKSGKYIVSAKEKDSIYNPAGVDFSKESKPKDIELYAHRRPVAKIAYTDNGNDTINLESKSYDLDFETRMDKGIQQEIWQYRFVAYDDTIIQDWKPITSLNGFRPDIKYKTDIKLTVKDYGARIDLVNDGELTDTDIITIDATGKPPIAEFEYKVGTTLANSVMADGEIYKGNAGKETLQLDDSYTVWNDFFGRATTRQITWSKNQAQLNSEIPSSSSLTTKLIVRNKYNLTDSITKSVDVKDIKINDNSNLINNKKNFNLNVNLSSSKFMNKWGNFKVVVTSNDLETTSFELDNVFSNRFTKNNIKVMDRNADNILNYTVSVYSKRTGELISRENYSLILNRPPTVSISVSPSLIYEGDTAKVSIIANDPDLDKLNLVVKHRVNSAPWSTIWAKDNVDSGVEQSFNMYNVIAGNNELMVIATDPHNATGTDTVSFKVLPIKVTGELLPNPAMAGDEVWFFITTEGYVEEIEIVVPDDIIAKDNRVAMGYKGVNYPSLFFDVDGSIMMKEDVFKYIVWVSTDLTLDKNNNRLRPPYEFIVKAHKGDITRETILKLDIKGDIRELLKPGIKNKYGK